MWSKEIRSIQYICTQHRKMTKLHPEVSGALGVFTPGREASFHLWLPSQDTEGHHLPDRGPFSYTRRTYYREPQLVKTQEVAMWCPSPVGTIATQSIYLRPRQHLRRVRDIGRARERERLLLRGVSCTQQGGFTRGISVIWLHKQDPRSHHTS